MYVLFGSPTDAWLNAKANAEIRGASITYPTQMNIGLAAGVPQRTGGVWASAGITEISVAGYGRITISGTTIFGTAAGANALYGVSGGYIENTAAITWNLNNTGSPWPRATYIFLADSNSTGAGYVYWIILLPTDNTGQGVAVQPGKTLSIPPGSLKLRYG